MTREELIRAINDNEERWSCHEYSCDKPEEEDNTGGCCLKCAEMQLSEYEKQVVSNFASWLTQKFDLRFSNNPSVWVDEYFNHTTEKLIKQLKGE